MNSNWFIGKYFSVPTYVHISTLFMFALLLVYEQHPVWYIALGFGIVKGFILYFSVLVHEFGHVLTGQYFKYKTEKVILMALGGMAFIDTSKMHNRPKHQMAVSIAGPITSLLLGGVFYYPAYMLNGYTHEYIHHLIIWGAGVNVILAIFNALPIFPLDGGQALRGLLSMRFGFKKATTYVFYVAFTLGGAAFGWAVMSQNFMLAIIIPLLLFGAWAEKENIDKHNIMT